MHRISWASQMKPWGYLLAVAVSFLPSIAPLVAQRETFVPPSDVLFKVFTDQSTYKVGESITLKYSVKNISNAALFVPREWEAICPRGPHLWAWFEDSS